jgi:hypothetical protein
MPLPTTRQVHVDTLLTNVAIQYIQSADNYIADKVFPLVPVEKKSDLYVVYKKGEFLRAAAKRRAPGTESAGGGYELDLTNLYICEPIAFHKDVSDQERQNATSPIDPDKDATNFVTSVLLNTREVEFAQKFFAPGVWSTELQGVSAAPGAGQFLQWDQANSDPIGDVRSAMAAVLESTGFLPNVLAMDFKTFSALADHPQIIERVKYGAGVQNPAIINPQVLAAIWGLEEVVVGKAVVNTAPTGASPSVSFVLPKVALLVYRQKTPSLMQPSAGYIFGWRGYAQNPYGVAIKRFRLEHLESDRIEGSLAYDQKVVAPDLGVLFKNTIA